MDLNADVGESFGRWVLGDDAAMLQLVTSANVACGFHAGDPASILNTCRLAMRGNVVVGAQVGYRDLAGFGRRFMDVSPADLKADVIYQIGALQALTRSVGTSVRYVKAHGALYHAVNQHEAQARALISAVLSNDEELALFGQPGSLLLELATQSGVPVVREGFADRGYDEQGRLLPRTDPGAVLTDAGAVAQQTLRLAQTGQLRHALPALRHPGRRHAGPGRPSRPGRRPVADLRVRPLTRVVSPVSVTPYGEHALLVQVDLDVDVGVGVDPDRAAADVPALVAGWTRALRGAALPGVVDLVPAAQSVLVQLADSADPAALRQTIVALQPSLESAEPAAELVEIPVVYDGPDLEEVARLTRLTPDEVVARHIAAPWRVAFAGFAPGFAYLTGGPGELEVPRRDEPRARVPAGSVALAAGYSAIYPRASPGGWQLIGRTSLAMWDVDHDPPALVTPGRRVRFVEAGR